MGSCGYLKGLQVEAATRSSIRVMVGMACKG